MGSPLLSALRDDIVRLCAPKKIYVFHQKTSPDGALTAVKLCVMRGRRRDACMRSWNPSYRLTCWYIRRRNGGFCWAPN